MALSRTCTLAWAVGSGPDLEPINMGAAAHGSGTVGAGSSSSPIEGGEQPHIVATGFAVGCLSCAHR